MATLFATATKLKSVGDFARPALDMTFARRTSPAARSFVCQDCGNKHVWSDSDQVWWCDTPRGYVFATTVRCLACQRGRRLALASL